MVIVRAVITCFSRKALCQALDPLVTDEDAKARREQVAVKDHTARQGRKKVSAQVLTAELLGFSAAVPLYSEVPPQGHKYASGNLTSAQAQSF